MFIQRVHMYKPVRSVIFPTPAQNNRHLIKTFSYHHYIMNGYHNKMNKPAPMQPLYDIIHWATHAFAYDFAKRTTMVEMN